MYLPDGLLTSGFLKHDVEPNPHIIAPDPLDTDDRSDDFSLVYQFPPLEPEELNTMNPSEDEPSSGLNGRLRPRKSAIPSPVAIKQIVHKLDGKQTQEKPKRSSTPSKASPSNPEDLSTNSNLLPSPQLLCPYCDRKFGSKQNVSKHIRRTHFSASKIDSSIFCLFCNHDEKEPSDIIRHMIDSHPNQYFACLDCHTRFPSTKQLAEHKLNICEKQKIPFRSKLRRKTTKKSQKNLDSHGKDDYSSKNFSGHGFNGIVISCELKPAHIHDEADIEDNITTNLILPPSKNISPSALEKNAVIVLDDIQWNRRIPSNFSFHNTDADQILSRLGVVHRSPKTGESTKKDWFKAIEDATQKFEKCFDTSFYSKVASNVHENLTKFLDGSFNFNPDPDSTVRTRKSKNSVVINTAEGFPILLSREQFARNTYDGYIPRTIAPKHKWKWDNLENEKSWNPDEIKRDTHDNNCIITLVSSLDIWTQLCMRHKFEDKFNITPIEKKTEKQSVISKELKEILESRDIPAVNSQIVELVHTPSITTGHNFPISLGLIPSAPKVNVKPAILSGEWVRPRCYVCCACGAQSRDSRALSIHIKSKHPNAQVQHYEIVGESLLKADILKHLYVPPNQNVNRTRPPRGFRDCTKCMKSITLEDLHQHMLDCAGDTPAVRRKCRYRPFGVRRRRPRLPDNRIRKKMRNDIRTRPTRQKNRMRSKPNNRSEVGDAETIRKMLADLPAKRHRVLVNPLNAILRPRRKLDKQRALLMMKRHTSDDLKGVKSKPSNTATHFDHQQTSTSTDRYKNATNRDDEDNEPLKPRMKRVACKITRQKESLNRKVMLKKPKRKVRLLMEKKDNVDIENELDTTNSNPVKVQTNELSAGQNDDRVHLNGDPEHHRENAPGQGDGNNERRDNQQPGFNNEDGNEGDAVAPVPNVPLNHSIARITASSETHNKSVQFHQLFLVQQGCNNTNALVPVGQQPFFENEAFVLKFDKPPLPNHLNKPLESNQEHTAEPIPETNSEPTPGHTNDQKNKLNKPRKGLNDCIAMLKNKLVVTDPRAPVHVSVQCGTDDPISPNPVLISPSKLISPRLDVVMKPVQTCVQTCTFPSSTEQPKKSATKRVVRNEQLPKPSPLYRGQFYNHDIYGNVNNATQQATQWRPVNYDVLLPMYIDNRTSQESSRRRFSSQHENMFFAQQLLRPTVLPTPANDDMLLKLSSESYNPYNLQLRKSPKKIPETFIADNNKAPSKPRKRKAIDKNLTELTSGSLQNYNAFFFNNSDKTRKPVDTSKKNTRTRVSAPRKQSETVKPVNIRKDVPKATREFIERYRKNSLDGPSQPNISVYYSGEKKSDNYAQIIRKRASSNVTTEVNVSQFKQIDLKSKSDKNVKMPVKVYTEHSHNDNQINLPLAHARTHFESILSEPLDLSSKSFPVEIDYSYTNDPTLVANYEIYESLDLSNKRITIIGNNSEDEVIDLRVKHTSEYNRVKSTEHQYSSTSQLAISTATAVNLVHQNECVPTDLSLKRKDEDIHACINLCQKQNVDEALIQDLSKNETKIIPTIDTLRVDDDSPTDLSNKKISSIEDITSVKESNIADGNESLTQSADVIEQNEPNDLSGKQNDEKRNDSNANETINQGDETQVPIEISDTLSDLSLTQKPVYDPTLRIPQYKIRPTETESTSVETNVTVAPFHKSISTCPESYSPHLDSMSTTNSISKSQDSTAVPSLIASIEAQERITYSFTKSTLNTAITCVTGSLPTYSLLHRGITTPFTTFESTRPVYALPNSCISMAKIDVTANNLLSIPSTTIMSTTPVYTLAGTTLVTPLNYVTLPSTGQSIPYPPPCGTYLSDMHSTNIQDGRSYDDNIFNRESILNFERDHDISRQFILPEEIGSILRTMPIDHRNQLLDVLLQYLSTLRPVPIFSTQTAMFQSAGPNTLFTKPIKLSNEYTVDASTDTVDIKPLYPVQSNEEEQHQQSNNNLHRSGQNSDLTIDNQVIDLTNDEIDPKADVDIVMDEEQPSLSVEEIPVSVAAPSNTPKTNNDKTASLRAVRIKTPSERQQLKIIVNPIEDVPCLNIPSVSFNDNQDNELLQSLDSDITSDIQMYEVSSTQTYKNKILETALACKLLQQPICEDATKSNSDLVVPEPVKDQQSELLKQNIAETDPLGANSGICPEAKEPLLVSEQINLTDDIRLNETGCSNVTLSVPKIDEKLTNHLNSHENDDDSDDDISLALILKQKQQNEKLKVPHSDTETRTVTSDNKTDDINNIDWKQTDKKYSLDTLLVRDTTENFENKKELDIAVPNKDNQKISNSSLDCIAEPQQVSGDMVEAKSKRLKKKSKKNHSDSLNKKAKTQYKKEMKAIENGMGINEENYLCKNDETIKEYNLQSNDNKEQKIHGPAPVLCSKDVIVSENVESIKDTNNSRAETKDYDGNEKKPYVVAEESKQDNKNVLKLSANPTLLTETCITDEKLNSIVNQIDATGSLEGEDANLHITDISQSKDVLKTFNEDDSSLPFRRTKRGSSLFLEANEQSLIHSESLLEKKVPLTKKQLIFSKLLLDEEKNLKSSLAVDENQSHPEENNFMHPAKPPKVFEEKNKPVKRKKSPHTKKKSKKNKCVDDSENIVSDDHVAELLVKETSSENNLDGKVTAVENYEDTNISLNSKQELDGEVTQDQDKIFSDDNNKPVSNKTTVPLDQNATTVPQSIVKRKIEKTVNDDSENSIQISKPKKTKLNNVNDNLVTLHSETITFDKNNYNTKHNLPLAARRARSKSVVVKSSGSMLYDPYDIDLEDMGDKTEPFRKQCLTIHRTDNYNLSKEHDVQIDTAVEKVTNGQTELNLSTIAETTAKESISDSDESSKSDVPLKKYVEDKERKSMLSESGSSKVVYHANDESLLNASETKQGKKKHKKNKRSLAIVDNVQKENKDDREVSEEQLRSEQFMESFGFFSERKPRKSNLLATKKISETFHIIANESDDLYYNTKERPSKKTRSENKKTVEEDNNKYSKPSDPGKTSSKSDKNMRLRSATLYCHVCKKEFRRTDNLVRHQLTLSHASNISESAMQRKTAPVPEEFNYLVVFKEHIDRLRVLELEMKNEKNPTKFTLPSLQEILLEVHKTAREHQLARRNLSRDQALFLDCCELLKDSNRGQIEERSINRPFFPCCPGSYTLARTSIKEYNPHSGLSLEFSRYSKTVPFTADRIKKPIIHTSARLSGMADFVPLTTSKKSHTELYPDLAQPSTSTSGLADNSNNFTQASKPGIIDDMADEKDDSKSDGDVDSITAQNILESEEVRNLENDLISGLKEAACKFQPLLSADTISPKNLNDSSPEVETDTSLKKETTTKVKNPPDSKERKNLDILENIDIFEDKFDLIKRKCRSQAAAAKLVQTTVESTTSHKSRKKSDKKKGKKNSKKHNQNTVLTKGALKGYDSIKVSILTSEIDMSAIVPPIVASSKKKKKRSSKKKKDKKNSVVTRKLDLNSPKESSNKNIDVYEFLDNEEPEIFELRPSTVMERFRNLNKREMQSSTKIIPNRDEIVSSDSVSDGDDFVYMSDDYVCSDDETENSLMSCELGNVKGSTDVKKSFSPLKRKDVMEKNAVMGKIFKHNAVRSEKKSVKPKETTKPKANLDQLFDSLLEEEPNSSMLMNDPESPSRDSFIKQKKRVFSPIILSKYDLKPTKHDDVSSKTHRSPSPALSTDSVISRRISSFSSRQSSPRRLSSSRFDIASPFDYENSPSKRYDDTQRYDRILKDYELPLTDKYDISENKYDTLASSNKVNDDLVLSPKSDKLLNTIPKSTKDKTASRKKEKVSDYGICYDYKADYYDDDAFSDDAGVARQRARRKCTVGKQNILAETWSSESELDGVPPRPNSAESVVMTASRKRKGRKREGQVCGGRKGSKHVSVKKQDFESRVTISNRNTGTSTVAGTSRSAGGSSAYTQQLSLPGPSGLGPRPRPTTSFWADGDEEPEHVQQHGWIVGDSHKKLVTMLAHAKGRKRNNDDKVRLVE